MHKYKQTESINQGFCIRRFKMSVLKYVIEFINEAICDEDFAEDNRIEKGDEDHRVKRGIWSYRMYLIRNDWTYM